MGRVIDSEAHAWIRLPANWRHKKSPHEQRAPLSARSAANFKPARPNPDGSFAPAEETTDDLFRCMDLHGVDISLIYPGPCMVPNDEISRVVAKAPDRLIGFAKHGSCLPPFATPSAAQAAADEIEHGLRDLGLKGLAEISCGDWYPEPAETAIEAMFPWFEICDRYNAPVIVHAHAGGGAQDLAHCHPATFRPLAAAFPNVPLVLAHMGGARRDFFDAALELADTYDNVRFNTSQSTPEFLTEAVQKIGAERIFFGVDWYALDDPETKQISQHRKQIAIVEKATMSDRERELVMGESIAALLALPP
jgi:predicted TIM-barrel fold metal-dependent hydrolase